MALRAIAVAESRSMGVVIHNQPLGIASAMHLHLAAARYHSLGHAVELFGHVMLKTILSFQLSIIQGARPDCRRPRLGVEPDTAALEKYRTAETSIITE